MSEFLSEPRLESLAEIIRVLCAGGDAQASIRAFDESCASLSQDEVAKVFQRLSDEGLDFQNTPEVVGFYYDVVQMKLSAAEIDKFVAGHPVRVYLEENLLLRSRFAKMAKLDPCRDTDEFSACFRDILDVEKHFLRKENQLFPCLEKHGWDSPSKNMWAFHDEIRAALKEVRLALEGGDLDRVAKRVPGVISEMMRLISIEEERLLPNAMEMLEESDWLAMRAGDEEIGWMLNIIPPPFPAPSEEEYVHPSQVEKTHEPSVATNETFHYDEGYMTPEQVNLIFKFLPMDITYVDENDRVVFYNRGDDRVFPRSAGIIGREVRYCHPPKSVDTVLRILEEFKKGSRDVADFRIKFKGQFIQIRYFAVRDEQRNYRGVLEMSQDITEIQALEGEKRLLEWD